MIFAALIAVNGYHGTKLHTVIRFSDLWDVLSTLLKCTYWAARCGLDLYQ